MWVLRMAGFGRNANIIDQSSKASHRRPPYGVIARITVVPDAKAQFKVEFEMLEEVPDELAEIVMARNAQQVEAKIGGYQPPQEKPQQEKKAGSLKGLRR